MQTVEVNCVQVFPCAYWRGLKTRADEYSGITTTGFDKSTWPPHSSIWCWHCCHCFDSVPAYLPMQLDLRNNLFYFIGNFCSWNCVKSYAFRMNEYRKPDGASYISLLAFLTAHRPRYCLYDDANVHPYTCPCIDMFKGVSLAPKKEVLRAFGGTMDIEEYRKDFLTIESYDWVNTYFNKNNTIRREMESLTSTQRRRAYTFCFVSYPGPSEASVDQVYILPLTHKTLNKKQTDENRAPESKTVPKKQIKPCNRNSSGPSGGRRRYPKSNAPAPSVASVAPSPVEPPPRVEPMVSEEQTFYINSVHKYGNLFSSMGITIEKKAK